MEAPERYTQYASSEFAVRSFIIKDEKQMMRRMLEWSKSDNELVVKIAKEWYGRSLETDSFSFVICIKQATKARLEYGIDYVKAYGKRNRKYLLSMAQSKGAWILN